MESNKKIQIRVAKMEDAKKILEIYAPYVTSTAISFEYEVPSIEEIKKRMENTMKKFPFLVAEQGDELLGYAYYGEFKMRPAYDWAIETSIYLDKNKKKMGIGGMLHQALEEYAKKQGILNMYACIASPPQEDEYLTNNSIEFHSHIGYRLVGEFKNCGYKFNRWYHMVWMEKQIGKHHSNQDSIILFPNL